MNEPIFSARCKGRAFNILLFKFNVLFYNIFNLQEKTTSRISVNSCCKKYILLRKCQFSKKRSYMLLKSSNYKRVFIINGNSFTIETIFHHWYCSMNLFFKPFQCEFDIGCLLKHFLLYIYMVRNLVDVHRRLFWILLGHYNS